MLRASARRVRDFWIYFKTGHSTYLVYSMSILNFIVLQHRLLIENIPFLSKYIPSLTSFFLLFMITYIPLAVGIGYFEFRKGEMTRRPMLNPYVQDTLEAYILQREGLLSFIQGDPEDATEKIEKSLNLLRKWKEV